MVFLFCCFLMYEDCRGPFLLLYFEAVFVLLDVCRCWRLSVVVSSAVICCMELSRPYLPSCTLRLSSSYLLFS